MKPSCGSARRSRSVTRCSVTVTPSRSRPARSWQGSCALRGDWTGAQALTAAAVGVDGGRKDLTAEVAVLSTNLTRLGETLASAARLMGAPVCACSRSGSRGAGRVPSRV